MCRTLSQLAVLILLSSALAAQEWRVRLAEDVVEIRDDMMVYDEIGLLKFALRSYQPTQWQVKLHSEAPVAGPLSRDQFVAITAATFLTLLQASLAQAYVQVAARQFLAAMDYTELDAAIGTPDLELNLVMTNNGMQVEVVNRTTGQRQRHTSTWEQFYEK